MNYSSGTVTNIPQKDISHRGKQASVAKDNGNHHQDHNQEDARFVRSLFAAPPGFVLPTQFVQGRPS
ncbi:hypothetical protein JTE90_013835 [Oedothorax gibbosus]|uniref:Uncharacterized protein n=1 Tax=Oedothorax gibbosus TaxID=931172 RepID=A0AAV6VK47_9ARAC|nr:hypothetical protein JTE90_013835 [Oedothorax gibbosus]